MLDWIPVLRSMVKVVGSARQEATGIFDQAKKYADHKAELTAMVNTANLRFNAGEAGMKAIIEKIAAGDGSEKDVQKLYGLLDETLDEVNQTLLNLSFDKDFGQAILQKKGLTVSEHQVVRRRT
jgi:hypothetical protein